MLEVELKIKNSPGMKIVILDAEELRVEYETMDKPTRWGIVEKELTGMVNVYMRGKLVEEV